MNIISRLVLFFILFGISSQSCNYITKSSNSKVIIIKSDSSINEDLNPIENDIYINPDIILNKRFYRIKKTGSRDIIIDNYSHGIDGLAIDSSKIKYYGSEEWRIMYFEMATEQMDIDSVVNKRDHLHLFLSLTYKTPDGDKEIYLDEIKIKPDRTNQGYIIINDEITLVDSIFANSIPVIQETLEDVKEAIGDF